MSEQSLDIAKDILLVPAGMGDADLQSVLDKILSHHIDYADLYFQSSRHESWMLENGIVKEGSFNIEQGAGVRAVSGEKTGFAYSDEIILPALTQAANTARVIAKSGQQARIKAWSSSQAHNLYLASDPLLTLSADDKVALLQAVDAEARRQDPRVSQVMASLAGVYEVILVAATDGTLAADIRPLVRMNVTIIVEKNGRREQGSAGGGGRYSFDYFQQEERGLGYAREAVRQALVNLEAVDAPAGAMPVVLGPGWPGVLLHEAVGHGLEGDFNRKGSSVFSGRMGQQVASTLCTVIDEGSISDRRGSLNIDDEGTPTGRTVLIENGILKGYMQDRLNARLMGMEPTGNGRRQSYAHAPMPRMTNTFMLEGDKEPDEILAAVDDGIYAVNFGGGQVDITNGKFVFSCTEAYRVKSGKILHPIKGCTLIGSGPDVLKEVSMIGNDLKLDPGVGTCGKGGQSVPAGVGQPTLLIDKLTVGGSAT